jgi:hypothetical protein
MGGAAMGGAAMGGAAMGGAAMGGAAMGGAAMGGAAMGGAAMGVRAMGVGAVVLAVIFCGARPARAGSFFDLSANSSSGQTVTVTGSNLITLSNNLLKAQNEFSSLNGQTYSASLTYGGVPNAVKFASNSTGTSVTLSLPTIGFSQTFTGTDRSNVEHQIRDFIEKNGSNEYARFLQSLDQISPVATNDGNPQAANEYFQTEAFTHFGLQPTDVFDAHLAGKAQFSITSTGGSFTTEYANGTFVTIDPSTLWQFNPNIGLEMSVPIEYRDTENASTYTVGYEIGLPISLIPATGKNGFAWRVTPWGFGGVTGSADLVAGGVMAGGGGSNTVDLRLGDIVLTMGNQIGYTTGIPVGVDKYSFDTRVTQWVLKNGGKITYSPKGPFFVDVGVTYSHLFDKAAVPDYWTPTAGIGVKFNERSGLRVGYSGDFGHGYRNNGGEADFYLTY